MQELKSRDWEVSNFASIYVCGEGASGRIISAANKYVYCKPQVSTTIDETWPAEANSYSVQLKTESLNLSTSDRRAFVVLYQGRYVYIEDILFNNRIFFT